MKREMKTVYLCWMQEIDNCYVQGEKNEDKRDCREKNW